MEATPERRRFRIINRQLQIPFLIVWGITAVCILGMAAGAILFYRHYVPETELDPLVVRAVLTILVFMQMFCLFMGVLTIRLTQKIAGPALRLERELRDLVRGKRDVHVVLRKGDSMVPLAEAINELAENLRDRKDTLRRALETLGREQNLPEEARRKLAHLVEESA